MRRKRLILEGDERVRSQEGSSGGEVAGVEEVEVMRILEVRKVGESGWERQIDEARRRWNWARDDGIRGAKAGGMAGGFFLPNGRVRGNAKFSIANIGPRRLSLTSFITLLTAHSSAYI